MKVGPSKLIGPALNPRVLDPILKPLPCPFSHKDTVWPKLRWSRRVALSTTIQSPVQVKESPLA